MSKFKTPKFTDPRKPYLRYLLFILGCGAMASLAYPIPYSGVLWVLLVTLDFVCFVSFRAIDWFYVEYENLSDSRLVFFEFCLLIINGLEDAMLPQTVEGDFIAMPFLDGALSMAICYACLLLFRSKKPPMEST